MSQVSDELLVAYLDGQLGTPQAQSVERMVAADEALLARVERLKQAQAYLIQTFETLARRTRAASGHARTERPRAPSRTPNGAGAAQPDGGGGNPAQGRSHAPRSGQDKPAHSNGRRLVLAGVVGLVAAVAGYAVAQWLPSGTGADKIGARVPAAPAKWAEDVAFLHAHFTPASVSADPESQSNRDLVELQLSRVVNKPVKVPRFEDHDLAFQRGQILSYRGSRMMQLSYTDAEAGLISLYIMPGGPGAKASAVTRRDVTTVNWSKNGVRYLLAGTMPENSLRALAAVAMSQFDRP
jgi:anti-sigma factor RsiW